MSSIIKRKLASLFAFSAAMLLSTSVWSMNPGDVPDTCEGDCGYARGPDPTESFLEADSGPYTIATSNVSSLVRGFGGGTIYYPVNAEGTMAAIVVIPGYMSYQSSISFWGPRLASHGFVVMTIDTNRISDQPPSRRDQIEAALEYLVDQSNSSRSPINGMVDPNRLGAVGWSMGGGGTLRLAADDGIQAAIGLAPWNTSSLGFRSIETPTLIFACERDSIAPVRSHASPFYNAIPSSTDKAYFEISGGNHYCANGSNRYDALLGKYGVAWMKLHLDQDQRYAPFLCGPNHERDRQISEHRSTCPF
ncbi:hypothetical protein CAI21_10815 [Alkalilimnicola ehrlichii]|uniref:PET hydrolase/cutinase-like domain-containing protein n=2 Tax=Alkalilimnicola ehrlichii TaxID=351052 RepID=A0A3E0WVY1_9GAMM|nr:dienelactone hydrolase family protein [Alkalilimnicola ehrlichii]RFA29245.1 hypothetical protein CAI21_10815 [Alkalilimnicola ehrlichii]RFA36156.1 hypothetical protein CAL65_11960 [Alkalilimnicola ehrlichii]